MNISSWIKVIFLLVMLIYGLSGCSPDKAVRKLGIEQVAPGVRIAESLVGDYSKDDLSSMLHKLAVEQYQPPVNAGFDNQGQIQPGRNGRLLNVAASLTQVLAAQPDTNVELVYDEIQPLISTEKLHRAIRTGGYTTRVLDANPNRLHNIRLTTDLINNFLLEAGQEFSFNRVTGEPTAERGFKEAGIFAAGGRYEEETGGGMCQVSSTLYNAVLAAGLPITERHPHSQPVDYVPAGKDATVYTDKDFRFMNNTRQAILIRAFESNKRVTVDLWSVEK
ncbi:hypothetical protein SPFL3102_03440 [Sporomusaceae bacterium FL31]|nr:hypothetical protein SPFL3101_03915 [Sporomusaceae bacterium FL31]GCE35589.1 hypothetical protein SPFL3102_03440 [Sporomusaceae bacterium]